MIIRPQIIEKTRLKNDLGFEENPAFDIFGRSFVKKRIARNNSGDTRIETMEIFPDDNYLVKSCSFGKSNHYMPEMGCDSISLKNTMYSTIELDSGKLLQWGSKNLSPFGNWMYAGDMHTVDYDYEYVSDTDKDKIYKCDNLNPCFTSGFDMSGIIADIYANEDTLQMPYSESAGLLTAFFSQTTFGIPTDSFVIIDTHRGEFNVPKFTYLGIIDKDQGKRLYANYIKHVSQVTDLITRNCKRYKRKLRIYVYSGVYSTVIKIHDIEHNGFKLDYNLSSSDHFSTIVHNIESEPNDRWSMSEESYVILHTDTGDVSDNMIINYQVNVPERLIF